MAIGCFDRYRIDYIELEVAKSTAQFNPCFFVLAPGQRFLGAPLAAPASSTQKVRSEASGPKVRDSSPLDLSVLFKNAEISIEDKNGTCSPLMFEVDSRNQLESIISLEVVA